MDGNVASANSDSARLCPGARDSRQVRSVSAGAQSTPSAAVRRVVVLFTGRVNDGSWNQAGYEGLLRAEAAGSEIAYTEGVAADRQLATFREFVGLTAMDLEPTAAEEAFRLEARRWLAANKPAAADAVGRHRRRLRDPPRVGTPAVRGRLGGRVLAARVRRPRRLAVGVADLRGGVLRGRASAARGPERHLPSRADRLRLRDPGAEGPHPPAHGRRRGHVVSGMVRARSGQRSGRYHQPGRARRRRRRVAAHRAEDVDDARRVLHAPVRLVPHRSGSRAPPRHDATSSSTSPRPA